MNDLQELFLKTERVKVLTQIYRLQDGSGGIFTQQKIADELDMPKSNVSRASFKMEDRFNLIESERSGREKYLCLTSEGREIAQLLNQVLEVTSE